MISKLRNFGFLAVLLAAVAVRSNQSDPSTKSIASQATNLSALQIPPTASDPNTAAQNIEDVGGLQILVHNEYTKRTGSLPVEYPWEYIVDPYKITTFELKNSHLLPESNDNLDYRWILNGHLQCNGKKCEAVFTDLGQYDMTVEAFWTGEGKNKPILSTSTITVTIKYVRREIRQLTDRDREAFFNAISIMQRVPTKIGQRLWGSKYFSKDYFVRIHLYYGGNGDCDHWHQGAGFVTSHMAYSLMFEQTLQAINPSLTLPYWDFTLESTFYEADTWRNSAVFSPDWFGNASPNNELHTVSRGRFAYVSTMANAKDYSAIYNSYGLLRSPWNSDPTPFMTRSGEIYGIENNMKPSGCTEYAKVLTTTSWMDLALQLNSAAHGHIHETVGGAWNHKFGERVGEPNDIVYLFAHSMQALSKILWREKYVNCPSDCDLGQSWVMCQCTCNTGNRPYEALSKSGILQSVTYFDKDKVEIPSFVDENGSTQFEVEGYTKNESNEIYSSLYSDLCNLGHIGDMFQATSSNDITFWVLHPTMDRLWHHKRMKAEIHQNFDDTWDDTANSCYGHHSYDIQPFKNLFGEENDHYYTNGELYELLHPNNMDLPYVYADFKWEHCTALGYHME